MSDRPCRRAYPSDVSDDEWAFVAPYLTLMTEHDLREMLRLSQGRTAQPTAAIFDGRTLQSTPESGARASYDGAKRKKGSKVHIAVDTLGHLLALHVTPANEQERAQVAELAAQVQAATEQSVTLAYVDQGYTGETPAEAARNTRRGRSSAGHCTGSRLSS